MRHEVFTNMTEIFCAADDFYQDIQKYACENLLPYKSGEKISSSRIEDSEIMTIMILFHSSHYRNFKAFYTKCVLKNLNKAFPKLVSYSRFVELIPRIIVPMMLFLVSRRGKCTGISFIDSTTIKACHIKREKRNKVFRDHATKSKSTMGWFFGFKLHLIINDKGDLLSVALTPANTDDRKPVPNLAKDLWGKLYGDKGYISAELFEKLFNKNLTLLTPIKRNMKNRLLPLEDKIMLRKRSLIETVNDILKNMCQIEHTRHRSPLNFLANLLSALAAYTFLPKKPSLRETSHEVEQYLDRNMQLAI